MIRIENLTKAFDGHVILQNVNAEINAGDVIGVLGPSGTGKSTLLRCINMLSPATSGAIYVDGENIMEKGYDQNRLRQKVGMVFQTFNLFDNMTAIENIMFPQIRLLHVSREEAFRKGMELLGKVGLKEKYLSYPAALSGGQKQRVAIARALVMNPEVILFDEPTSALDPSMVDEVQEIIRYFAKAGTTMMIVTHEMNFARSICSRIFYMDKGTLYEEGPTEQIFENPVRERTRVFMKRLKTFTVTVDESLTVSQFEDLIREFSFANSISAEKTEQLKELLRNILGYYFPKVRGREARVRVLAEYDRKTEKTDVIIFSPEKEAEREPSAAYFKEQLEKIPGSGVISAESVTDDKYSAKYLLSL